MLRLMEMPQSQSAVSSELPRESPVELRREISTTMQELVREGLDKDTINWVISHSDKINERTKRLAMIYINMHLGDRYTHTPGTVDDIDTLRAVGVALAEVTKFTSQLRKKLNGDEPSLYD